VEYDHDERRRPAAAPLTPERTNSGEPWLVRRANDQNFQRGGAIAEPQADCLEGGGVGQFDLPKLQIAKKCPRRHFALPLMFHEEPEGPKGDYMYLRAFAINFCGKLPEVGAGLQSRQ
jgi:hypothetical protein